jgi:hypothetical protein
MGRLALGLVGAAIGSFFANPALGFAIGSAIGGFIFAPEGPHQEGPRIGDTDVTASSLGKIIPFHYGITRAAGNVFWSGGLKETKTVTENGGGKGGGGGGTITTYSYSSSFAVTFGRAPAESLLRMWSDGKLIYDATGTGDVQNDKYNFRFKRGGSDTRVDSLIAESVNRRLAGLPDINEGTGPQSEFRTMGQLIAETQSSGDARSAIYADYLTTLKNDAEAAGGTPPDYMYTPSYKELCYVVFDDIPLEDFGNRIPNITAEIVWSSDSVIDPDETISETIITEISVDTTVPSSAVGVDPDSESLVVISGTRLRRFSSGGLKETLDRPTVQKNEAQPEDSGQNPRLVTVTAEEILGADANGNFIARISRTGEATTDIIGTVTNTSLSVIGGATGSWHAFTIPEMDAGAASITFASSAGTNAARALIAGCNPSGQFYVYFVGSVFTHVVWGVDANTFTGLGEGPMAYGGGGPGKTTVYWASDNGTNWALYKVDLNFSATPLATPSVTFTTIATENGTGERPRSVMYDTASGGVIVLLDDGPTGVIKRYDPDAAGTGSDPYEVYSEALALSPPQKKSGMQRSTASTSVLAYARGTSVIQVDISDGSSVELVDVLSETVTNAAQVYTANSASLFTWIDGTPTRIQFSRIGSNLYSTDLASVITDICDRAGMESDEYTVESIVGEYAVRGYTIGRPSSGRKSLENLLLAYFVDGVESDWKVAFKTRSTTPIRTINESELGAVKSPTGDVYLLESRQPEYDLPSEVAMIYVDQDRDYQQGAAHMRRVSQPTPVMYSNKTMNIEMPMVMLEHEARDIAQKLLFLTWMSRDTAQANIAWTHADLDPADVIQYSLDDGRTLTDRISRATMGANFEIEMQTARSGDPVYVSQENAPIGSSNIPVNTILTPVFSKMFVFDIPLLYDYHDLARVSSRFYAGAGSDTVKFLSADLFQSTDAVTYASFDTATVDVTWGQVSTALRAPRSLWTIDEDNTVTVVLSVDNGDISSTTLDGMLNNEDNRALLWDAASGVGEIFQFQNVVDNGDGSVTLSTLLRGRRGTDYMVEDHIDGEFFILLTDSSVLPQTNPLAVIGSTQYFKAVSRGALLGNSTSVNATFEGRDMKPYAPSNVARSDDGTDLTINWNRRSRIGGEWNMFGTGIEEVPLNEDTEVYEFYLIGTTIESFATFDPLNSSTYMQKQNINVEQAIVTGTDLGVYGVALLDTIYVAVYQLSAQVGRGFVRKTGLAP